MAYNDSPDIKPGLSNEYDLGDYTFQVTSAYDSQRNKTDIMAYCGLSEEDISKSAVKTISVDGDATVDSWHVEVNEYEASVYASINAEAPLVTGSIPAIGCPGIIHQTEDSYIDITNIPSGFVTCDVIENCLIVAFPMPSDGFFGGDISQHFSGGGSRGTGLGWASEFTFADQKVGFYQIRTFWSEPISGLSNLVPRSNATLTEFAIQKSYTRQACIAWSMIFSANPGEKEILVAKFPIEIGPAGGGPGGGWDIPGDTGDPSYTLHVTVNGASSGTHDDTYNAADNESVKGYGFGGDGGYGGGGGAGASTTIIDEFATDKAGYVDQRAYAQPPGLGGMGGKGGKGGDGCILIFY